MTVTLACSARRMPVRTTRSAKTALRADQRPRARGLKRGPQRIRLRDIVIARYDAADDDIAVILAEVLERTNILAGEKECLNAAAGFVITGRDGGTGD